MTDARNPYLIQGPAQISFSGGRSSGLMLYKIWKAHNHKLPPDVVTTFANTGKEREETLAFIDTFSRHYGITIHWIEYRPNGEDFKMGATQDDRWVEVSYETASRNSEPFDEVLRRNGRPATVVDRICSNYLKTKPMDGFCKSVFGTKDYTHVIGIRADEPMRVARMRGRHDIEVALPLADAGITKEGVKNFWNVMPFDLALPSLNGETPHGNCDLCFLKNTGKIISLIREEPARADWWIKHESGGALFRIDRPNYATLKLMAMQPQLFDAEEEEEALPCECTD